MAIFENSLKNCSKPFSLNRSSELPEYMVMHKDTELFLVNDQKGTLKVVCQNKNLLPFALRGLKKIRYTDYYKWASERSLNVARENAKKILNSCDLSQTDKFEAARQSRLLSIEDRYWIRENEKEKWKDFDLRKVPLSKSVSVIALDGHMMSLQGDTFTAEITNRGSYPQCWERDPDGHLYLYKKSKQNNESKHEVLASEIMDLLGVDHIHYEMDESRGPQICKCRCMTEKYARLTYQEFEQYCYHIGIDPIGYIDEHFERAFGEMLIMDYVLSNPDRHGGNWGFLYDDNGRILKMHPLMDQNLSFSPQYKVTDTMLYQLGMDSRELAAMAQRKLKIDFSILIDNPELKQRFKEMRADYRTFQRKCTEMNNLRKALQIPVPKKDRVK